MTEIRIYVGLNDSQTMKQEHETEKYVSVLQQVCQAYRVPFSFTLSEGGYFHDDGTYTKEKSLVLSLIGAERDIAREIAGDLCAFFHQESVLVTEGQVESWYVREEPLEPLQTENNGSGAPESKG